MGFGWTEIIIITGVILLLFGPKQLPKLARSLGQSFSEIKQGMNEIRDEMNEPVEQLENEATGYSTNDSDTGNPGKSSGKVNK